MENFRKSLCWKHCKYKEWVSFFLGSWGMNRSAEQTNRPRTASLEVFSLICILKPKSEAKGITRNLIPTIEDITDFIVKGPYVPLLANIFLYSYEEEFLFIQSLLSAGKIQLHVASRFHLTYSCIDDVLSIKQNRESTKGYSRWKVE